MGTKLENEFLSFGGGGGLLVYSDDETAKTNNASTIFGKTEAKHFQQSQNR